MQVFIVGNPLETAMILDSRRLNKQIIETEQIIKAITGESKAWNSHPVVKMYKDYFSWLMLYKFTLIYFRQGDIISARNMSGYADIIRPNFHTCDFFDQMKRRLYTKDDKYYSQWSYLGKSDVNWYYVSGSWLYYKNGKRL